MITISYYLRSMVKRGSMPSYMKAHFKHQNNKMMVNINDKFEVPYKTK